MRFPEFSGEWKSHQIKEIASIVGGGTPDTNVKEYWAGDINWYTPSEIGKTKYVNRSMRRISHFGVDNSSAKILPEGTILLSTRATIGEKSITETECCTNQGFQSVIPNVHTDTNFCYYALDGVKSEMIRRASGSTFLEISSSQLSSIHFRLPDIREQRKIGLFLSLIDERIETQSKIIEEQETLLKSLADKLFSTFDTDTKLHLGDIAELYQPKTISLSNLSSKGYPVYGANGIIGSYNKFNHMTEQICIACRGSSCGSVNYTVPKAWITGNAMVVNTDNYSNIIDKRYLYYYLRRINYSSLISGSGQPQIVRAPLAKLVIPVPTLEKQKHEVIILDTVGQMLETNKIILQCYQNQKAYLLSRMFI